MCVFRINKNTNYTVMSNYHLRDERLSLKAKGLLSQMLSLPEDWDYSIRGLIAINKENGTAIRGAIKELENCGYLVRTRIQVEHGHFDYEYNIFELPQTGVPSSEKLQQGKPCIENRCTENRTQQSKEEQSKEKQITIVSKDTIALDSEKQEKEFGNKDINEAMRMWQDATGFDFTSVATERRAMYNLLRRKDIEAYGGFKALVSLVKDANDVQHKYAPKIAKPSELGGKYSKLEKLVQWQKQQQAPATTTSKPNVRPLTDSERARIDSLMKSPSVLHEPPITPWTEEEKKEAHEFCQKLRANLPFLKKATKEE